MVWLQNNERFNEVARYDPATREIEKLERSSSPDLPSKTDGFYSYLSSVMVAIFRFEGRLFVRTGEHQFPLTEGVKIDVSGSPGSRVLTVRTGDDAVATIRYAIEIPSWSGQDLTPFVEDEDNDFGLFLSNISKNPGRQEVMLAA